MRYRLATLCLAVLLGVLPALTIIPAAPAPKRTKPPAIYALVYVGLGKNDPDNTKRLASAVGDLRSFCVFDALNDVRVRDLPLVQNKMRGLSRKKVDEWGESKTCAARVGETAVMRVWFTDGSPQEQMLIVNTLVRDYLRFQEEHCSRRLELLEVYWRSVKTKIEASEVPDKEARIRKLDKEARRKREALKRLPQVIEWASIAD